MLKLCLLVLTLLVGKNMTISIQDYMKVDAKLIQKNLMSESNEKGSL